MTLYLHTPVPPSSFVRGLVFLWQESPSFYGYMLGFLMLSLLLYSIKLKSPREQFITLWQDTGSACVYIVKPSITALSILNMIHLKPVPNAG